MKSRLLALVAAPMLVGVVFLLPSGCTRDPGLGPIQRLNEVEGGASSFSWAYYTSIVAAGDRVAVAWMNQNGKMNRNIAVRRSTDRGETWSSEILLNTPDYANTVSVVPTLAILPGENDLFAVWQTRRNEAGQKFVLSRRSNDFGATWGGFHVLNSKLQSFLPVLAQRAEDLVVAWTDERNVHRDIYANRSTDAGATWLEQDRRVSSFPKSEVSGPTVAIGSGDSAYLVWEERPQDQGEQGRPHLRMAVSQDLGASWSSASAVDTGVTRASPIWPQLVWSEGRLTLVWVAGVTGKLTGNWLWSSSSADDGKTWSKPVEIYSGATQPFFHLRTVGPQVYLAWHGAKGDTPGGIYWNASDDGGKTWRRAWDDAERLDAGTGSGAAAMHPRIGVDGDLVAVTWQENYERIAAAASRDRGRSWSLRDTTVATREDPSDQLRNPQVAVSGTAAYVVWERWPDKKKHIKSFADIDKKIPKDAYVRRVDLP